MPDPLTPTAERMLSKRSWHADWCSGVDLCTCRLREFLLAIQSEARATADAIIDHLKVARATADAEVARLRAERDALRAALEDIADRYVSDNNIRPAGFATWAGERALAALATPAAPAAEDER